MSEERARRSDRHKKAEPEAAPAPGYRSTRRTSPSAKKAKRAEEVGRVQAAFAAAAKRLGKGVATVLAALIALALVAAVLFLSVNGVNAFARWYAKRQADAAAAEAAKQKVRGNLLVIAVQENAATGFLAMRVDDKTHRAFGIAIPDGAFVEVPGQGFEKIGDSLKAGPTVSLAAVSNYLGVPFENYVMIDDGAYKAMMKDQDVSGLVPAITGTNLTATQRDELSKTLAAVPGKNVGLAPLPVRSVAIGTMTYFEPQRDQIADLLYSWWGVKIDSTKQSPRVIIYNGAGQPGIAGEAAKQLIKAGFRVVSEGNADRFDYAATQIVLLRGDGGEAMRVRDILGTGDVVRKLTDEDITDLVVIIGRDYKPPAS